MWGREVWQKIANVSKERVAFIFHPSMKLQGVTSQKKILFTVTAVRTSNLKN
jgi:hypothetical protein